MKKTKTYKNLANLINQNSGTVYTKKYGVLAIYELDRYFGSHKDCKFQIVKEDEYSKEYLRMKRNSFYEDC